MRDKKIFCRPKVARHPKLGDVYIKLGKTVIPVTAEEYNRKIKNYFKVLSFVGSDLNKPGNIIVTSKELDLDLIISVEDFDESKFELKEVIGNKYNLYNGYDYVEIGGLKWATKNIGASTPTDTGLYFQWGDTQGYTASQVGSGEGQKYFAWEDYKYGISGSNLTKYNSTDGLTTLETTDDAVQANWGDNWRMPTTAEFQALGTATTSAWTADYEGSGVAGLVLTSKADNSKKLFFPAAGFCSYGNVGSVGMYGSYWSSSVYYSNLQDAYFFSLGSSSVKWGINSIRYNGFPVRGVVVDSNDIPPEKIAQCGDILVHNDTLNIDAIFSFDDWVNNDDKWNIIGLYGINTYEEETAEDGSYVIMSNGTTLIIDPDDYSKVNDHWEQVDMILNGFVDLGLPSGTLWSTVNVGAQTPFQRGQYFSWGNIEGYVASYNEGDYSGEIVGYSFILSNYELTNGYQLSGSIPVENDAAVDIMGGEWNIPTDTQFQELFDNCTITWVTKNGVPGKLFTSNINGKTLFIINNGYGNATTLDSPMYLAAYWTNAEDDVDTSKALSFVLGPSILPNLTPIHPEEKRFGFGIRAVKSSV